jgi:hypothetical protein
MYSIWNVKIRHDDDSTLFKRISVTATSRNHAKAAALGIILREYPDKVLRLYAAEASRCKLALSQTELCNDYIKKGF